MSPLSRERTVVVDDIYDFFGHDQVGLALASHYGRAKVVQILYNFLGFKRYILIDFIE